MKDRIERRIEQLQQEKDDLRIASILRDKEIGGQMQALRDVLTAMTNAPADEKELAHV